MSLKHRIIRKLNNPKGIWMPSDETERFTVVLTVVLLLTTGHAFGDQVGVKASTQIQDKLDTTTLGHLLEKAGYAPDPSFKAYVAAIEHLPDGTIQLKEFDYRGTSLDRDNWWPASTVKLFAAVAALEILNKQGFSPKAEVTFHYETGEVTQRIDKIVELAITPSNNTAFDRLVEIVGFEAMNQWFQINKITDTVLLRGYSRRVMDEKTNLGTLRESPSVTVNEGSKSWTIPARSGDDSNWKCPNQGNCTTLQDLSKVLIRVMTHESIAETQRFKLGKPQIQLLKKSLSGKRSRGLGVVHGLEAGFEPQVIKCFNKPGYAYQWFSDHVFIDCPKCPGPIKNWIVAMAGHGGRDVLDEGAKIIGQLIASGELLKGHPDPSTK